MNRPAFALAALAVLCSSSIRADGPAPAAPAAAEKKVLIGGEVLVGLPLGNWADVNSFGLGLMMDGEYLLLPQITLTGRLGYEYHLANNDLHSGVIPLQAGARYYLAPGHQGLFGYGEVGFNLISYTVSTGGFSATSSSVYLGLGAGAGYQMGPLSFKLGIQSLALSGGFGGGIEISAHAGYQLVAF